MNDDRYLKDLNIPPTTTAQQRKAGITAVVLGKKNINAKPSDPKWVEEMALVLEALGIKDYESGKSPS